MILVFGHAGQVATELRRQADVTALGRAQADLAMPGTAAAAIREAAPTVVINAAAYTAVDAAEAEPEAAHRLNADAPAEMAVACASLGIPLLHVSTDYVFDGSGTAPWRESDPVAPLNVYGRSKLAGEVAIRDSGAAHVILRTSWVFSAHGANFVKTMLRLSDTRDSLTVVADQIGGPTPAAAIAKTLLRLAYALRDGGTGGTFHYAGAPDVSWAGFAREIFAKAGRDVAVSDIPTRDYPTEAARPLNSRLDGTALEQAFGIARPDWRAGLDAVLTELEIT